MNWPADTVKGVAESGLCTGCGTCAGICPTQAISMRLNEDQTEIWPTIDTGRCVHCGLCVDACPGIEVDFERLNEFTFGCQPEKPLIGVFRTAWAGYSRDDGLRYHASSGGAVTELLAFALDKGLIDGAVVATADQDAPLRAVPTLATSREALVQASGSKYSPVAQNIILQDIRERDGRFALVGLPCHIHGLRKAALQDEQLSERIRYVFGLACGRVSDFNATRYYLRGKGIEPEEVRTLRYRGEGWPGKITVSLKDGTERAFPRRYSVRKLLQAIHHNASFGFQHFKPWRCLTCPDRAAELADLSFSDPYLPRFMDKDRAGHTLIVARSEKGEELVKAAHSAGRIMLDDIGIEDTIESHKGELRARKSLSAMFRAASLGGKECPSYRWAAKTIQPTSVSDSLSCLASIVERWMGKRKWAWPLIVSWTFIRTFLRYASKVMKRTLGP